MVADDTPQPEHDGRLLDGRYRLGDLLGQGGAAVVYEAVDLVLGRRVAVKLYQATEPVGRYRFASEARLLAGLSHPGLVTVYDVSLDGDQPFLVLRLVDGPTLRDVMNPGPLGAPAVAKLGARLAESLAYVHARDVVHRDIKPSNILVEPSGEPLLSDFGLARALGAVHLTRTGEYVGTAAYLAPEQITEVDVGPPADVYALGLVLLECLTGRTEYTGNAAETALARLSRRPRIPEELPAEWRTVIEAMTAQEPADRPSASHCAEMLAAAGEGRTAALPAVPEPRTASQTASRRARNHRARPVYAGVAALALAAVAAVAATTTDVVPGYPTGQPSSPETTRTEPTTAATPVDLPATQGTNAGVVPPPQAAPPALPASAADPAAADPPAADPAPGSSGKNQNKGPKNDKKSNGKGSGKG